MSNSTSVDRNVYGSKLEIRWEPVQSRPINGGKYHGVTGYRFLGQAERAADSVIGQDPPRIAFSDVGDQSLARPDARPAFHAGPTGTGEYLGDAYGNHRGRKRPRDSRRLPHPRIRVAAGVFQSVCRGDRPSLLVDYR